MRSFFLFVLLIAGASAFTRNPPEVFYEASDHHGATRFGKSSRMQKAMSNEEIAWEGQVTGLPRETREEARAAAIAKASEQIGESLGLQLSVAPERVINLVIGEKESDVDLGPTMPAAKATTLTLEVTNEKARQLASDERSTRASGRLKHTSRVVAVIVASLFVVAGYCRLADWTKSRCRRAV